MKPHVWIVCALTLKECAVLRTIATAVLCYLFRDEIVRSGAERGV
jgi:hypothetical protein